MASQTPHDPTGLLMDAAFWLPERFVPSAWHAHAPFAFWVVDAHRPSILVELGTHHGFSYLAFCQAVQRSGTGTRCFAIDHWKGDEHAGFYGDEVFESLSSYHDPRYGSFSELVRSSFDEASTHFEDGSVDLLHIDGAHRLEDVRADFETWLPKMSDRGVILFHDINVHRDTFGVHALWDGLKSAHPHFDFDHGHGLGVLGVGSKFSDRMSALFGASGDEAKAIRSAFARLGGAVADRAAIEMGPSTSSADADRLARDLEALRRRAAADRSAVTSISREMTRLREERDDLLENVEALRLSTSWRVTAPLRAISKGAAWASRHARRAAKLVWWTVTLQLPRRLRAYRRTRRGVAEPATMSTPTVSDEVARTSRPGPDFELRTSPPDGRSPLAKLIAFYLPQFHAIPENDAWWGKGFTEWTNVIRGLPRFVGHYQPRTPGDLGFYDLTDPKVMPRQIEMARESGIHGFCFYYYRFTEGRILERPVEAFVADPTLDMPFCVMWANENWTRTWDGQEQDVLRAFEYDAEVEEGWLEDLARYVSDGRYIRIGGRPLVLVYRPGLFPDAAAAFQRWRRRIEAVTGTEPLILNAQCIEKDPGEFGLDGAVEFPPHKFGEDLPDHRGAVTILDPDFAGNILSYRDLVDRALAEPLPPFPLIRTVSPFWDNEARRNGRGLTFAGSTPRLYERWLDDAIRHANDHPFHGEPLVFVNAWNEWAEGTYLEPDVHYGWAYLNATTRALHRRRPAQRRRKVLLVGHDALPRGSQRTLLHLGRMFVRRFGVDVEFLLFEGGALLDDYREVAPVRIMSPNDDAFAGHLSQLAATGFTHAITNTVVTGPAVAPLRDAGFTVLSLVHEMGAFMTDRGWLPSARRIADHSDVVVFPHSFVADRFAAAGLAADQDRVMITAQGLYREPRPVVDRQSTRSKIREGLGIERDRPVVLGVGHGDLRKGFDLFVQSAALASDLEFVWLGSVEYDLAHWLTEQAGTPRNLHVVPHTEDVHDYYVAADVLYLSSREDAFPSTVLEGLSTGLPSVGFAGCTGTADLIETEGALVTPYDLVAAVDHLRRLVREASPAVDADAATRRIRAAETRFRFDEYAFGLLRRLFPSIARVSVIVPTYNYARYLRGRLASIFDQTHPVFELMVLDDASTDETDAVLAAIAADTGREFRVVRRSTNSGAIVRQWLDGVQAARGEVVWIAEADDLSEPEFLERMVAEFSDDPPVFAFCDSAQADADGRRIGDSYREYLSGDADIDFASDFRVSGDSFLRRLMSVRNPVLNANGALFRRDTLLAALEEGFDDLSRYRFAFDWHLYADLCRSGDVSYVAAPLNVHRRHEGGATFGSSATEHVQEIERVHQHLRDLLPDEDLAPRQARYIEDVKRHLAG